jgi:16S rRNA processing protein RimM
MMKDFIEVGYISRTHGVRGGVVVKLYNVESRNIRKGVNIFFKAECDEIDSFKVSTAKYGNSLILSISGIDVIELAQRYVGKKLYLSKAILREELKVDEFLINDILGYEAHDVNGEVIGLIDSFSSNGTQDIARVKRRQDSFVELLLVKPIVVRIEHEDKKVIFSYSLDDL